jgi:hypothetical protein
MSASPPRRRLGDRLMLHAPVQAVDQIAARMIRIRLALSLPDWTPGQQVRGHPGRTALRTLLISDRGWPRRSIITKPFWTPGKTGLELGRPCVPVLRPGAGVFPDPVCIDPPG